MEAVAQMDRAEEIAGPEGLFRPVVVVTVALLTVVNEQLLSLLEPGVALGWRLPTVSPRADQSLEATALAEVECITGLPSSHLEQLGITQDYSASPDGCRLEVAYLALMRGVLVQSGPTALPSGRQWWPSSHQPPMPPEHARILAGAHERLRDRLSDSRIAGNLLDGEFTLSELQEVYETVQCRTLDKRNFRKWILGSGLVESTPRQRREGAHRPARLYRFT